MYTPIPSSTWSYSRNFPVEVYYEGNGVRIIITAGMVTHNAKWIHNLTPKDYVFCSLPFYPDYAHLKYEYNLLTSNKYNKENWFVFCNTYDQLANCEFLGLNGILINNNCFLDEKKFAIIDCPRYYGAIYNARTEPWKRHFLAAKVPDLALITGWKFEGCEQIDLTKVPHVWTNNKRLTEAEVSEKVQEANCGLILSEKEGACYASGEYLLCGVPVVSTLSFGGRDLWYDKYNSVICESTADGVKRAVEQIQDRWKRKAINRQEIRDNHIKLAEMYRSNFVNLLGKIFKQNSIEVDPQEYFQSKFRHKLMSGVYVNEQEVCKRLNINSLSL